MKKFKINIRICLFILLTASPFLLSQAQQQKRKTENVNNKTIIKKGTIITGELEKTPFVGDVYIKGNLIEAVVKENGAPIAGYENASIIDAKGKYILPGFIDSHVHIATQADGPLDELKARINSDLSRVIKGGVTTVRDLGGDGRILAYYQRAANRDQIISPDIYYAAFLIGPNYAKMAQMNPNDPHNHQFFGWEQLVEPGANAHDIIAMAKGSGATGIKIYSDISVKMEAELAAEAKKQGMEVWAHATVIAAKPTDAIKAGVKVISHAHDIFLEQADLSVYGNSHGPHIDKLPSDFEGLNTLAELMKKHDAILDATVYLASINGRMGERAFVATKALHKAGAKISVGTDWMIESDAVFPNIHKEMKLLVEECGFSTLAVINAATQIGAESIGLTDRGVLVKGKRADILILNSDPIANIDATKDINEVIKNGILYKDKGSSD